MSRLNDDIQNTIIKAVGDSIATLLNPSGSDVFKIFNKFLSPSDPDVSQLPAIFYGYGRAFPDNRVPPPSVNDRVETLTIILYAILHENSERTDVSALDRTDRDWWINNIILTQSGTLHNLIQGWVIANQTIGTDRVLRVGLGGIDTAEGKLKSREMMQINLEITYYYSLYNPNDLI